MTNKFTHLFFDTNALEGSWPGFSIKVDATLKAARSLGVTTVIPQPVLAELNKHWRNDIDRSLKNAKSTLRKVAALVGLPDLPRAVPEWGDLESGYDYAIENILRVRGLEVGEMPQVTAGELFEQANREVLVFEDHGSNFKDAVILYSVIEHLQKHGGTGALVSDDKIFHRRRIQCEAHAAERKVSLSIFSLVEAEAHFQNLLGDESKQRIARHRRLAEDAVKTYLPAAQSAFNAAIQRQRSMDPNSRLPIDVEFTKIGDVDVTVFDEEPSDKAEMRVSAIFSGIGVDLLLPEEMIRAANPLPIEAGMVFAATFDNNRYAITGIESMIWAWPSIAGSIAHPNWRSKQQLEPVAEGVDAES